MFTSETAKNSGSWHNYLRTVSWASTIFKTVTAALIIASAHVVVTVLVPVSSVTPFRIVTGLIGTIPTATFCATNSIKNNIQIQSNMLAMIYLIGMIILALTQKKNQCTTDLFCSHWNTSMYHDVHKTFCNKLAFQYQCSFKQKYTKWLSMHRKCK